MVVSFTWLGESIRIISELQGENEKYMKNTEVESEIDELRPEYKGSDFGKFDRGAVKKVDFAERVAILLACIGGEEKLTFVPRSFASPLTINVATGHMKSIMAIRWTLRYWLSSLHNIEVSMTNPQCIFTAEDNNNLIDALTTGVRTLMAKVADHS